MSRELESWFAECSLEVWPTYRTFVHGGRKRLHAAVMRTGGPQRWAVELGVPLVAHRPGPALGVREIELSLRRVLREHRPHRFPTNAWLRRHGPPGLAAAVRRTGGGAHWARVVNMPAPQPARWTDELIEAELRRVCADNTHWPTRADFARARATGVLRAVYAEHGSRWWTVKLGLSSQRLRPRRAWHRSARRSACDDTVVETRPLRATHEHGEETIERLRRFMRPGIGQHPS